MIGPDDPRRHGKLSVENIRSKAVWAPSIYPVAAYHPFIIFPFHPPDSRDKVSLHPPIVGLMTAFVSRTPGVWTRAVRQHRQLLYHLFRFLHVPLCLTSRRMGIYVRKRLLSIVPCA
jgi:hypothetical protein